MTSLSIVLEKIGKVGCLGAALIALALVAGCTVIVAALPPYGCPT